MIKLYRVVSRFEKYDFDNQYFRTGRNTLEVKQFFKSLDAINEFVVNARLQQYYPRYEYLLIISVNKVCFNTIPHTNMELDGYDAISIPEDNLPAFNKCIKFVQQEQL